MKPSRSVRSDTALTAILRGFQRSVAENVVGALDAGDSESLHILRVGVRRARTALKLTGDVLPRSFVEPLAIDLRGIGDATTPTRDLNVYVLGFIEITADLSDATAAGLAPFHDLLLADQALAQQELSRYLVSPEFAAVLARWAESVGAGHRSLATAKGKRPIGEVANNRIRLAHRRVLKLGRRIDEGSPAESLHDLRKRSKELRYALEMFKPWYRASDVGGLVDEVKVLQENLGALHDSHFQRVAIAGYAKKLLDGGAAVHTIMAMGALTQVIESRERTARREFALTFARFSSPRNGSRFKSLVCTDT